MTINVVDFFSGCGGTSAGFKSAGMKILAGLDIDRDAGSTFKLNHPTSDFLLGDVSAMKTDSLDSIIGQRRQPLLFSGCAPCQPFSKQNRSRLKNDPRSSLLNHFLRFVEHWRPEFIFVENVPGIQKVGDNSPFSSFIESIDGFGYNYSYAVVPALNFGVPQRRSRLVLVASLISDISLPNGDEATMRNGPMCVKDFIKNLPPISAGQTCKNDPEHRAARLSDINLQRIAATPEGGSRNSWPEHLRLKCHSSHSGHSDVYGRMAWDKPATALTTRCISYSNGRFGHPEQDRAISVREAALLQTFSMDYKFSGNLASKARQIGNAVPPKMAKIFGNYFLSL